MQTCVCVPECFRETKVDEVYLVALRPDVQKEVVGLDIAMYEVAGVYALCAQNLKWFLDQRMHRVW